MFKYYIILLHSVYFVLDTSFGTLVKILFLVWHSLGIIQYDIGVVTA